MLFLRTALKVHRILQLPLYGCDKGCFIRSYGVGAVLLSNVTEDTFQVICNQASEILVLSDLRDFQRPQVQIIFLAAVFHQCHLPDSFQHGIHMQLVTTKRTNGDETPGAILRAGTTFGKSGKIECKNQSK